MRRFIFPIVIILAMCSLLSAQSFFKEVEKVKQLKLLESTKEDAISLLNNEEVGYRDFPDDNFSYFYTQWANFTVYYSNGSCSDKHKEWNVSKGKIVGISLSPKSYTEIKDTGIDKSNFRRERLRKDYKKLFVYHDKEAGIAVTMYDTSVEEIQVFPSKKHYSKLCNKPELKKYYSKKKLIVDRSMYDATYHNFPVPNVIDLHLSKSEIVKSFDSNMKIKVLTENTNPMNDVITYDYRVTAGKVIGKGKNIIWDLSGVKPGTYKITAIADSGCGPCGKWMTKTVTVKYK